MSDLTHRLRETIHRRGPVPFDVFMEAALYDPVDGFFMRGDGAGRGGADFLTSPEVGSLFGALVSRALDGWWSRLGRPDPFVVVEAGAGRGQLARDVLRALPACAQALRYVLVERSPVLRQRQHEHLDLEPADEALGPAVRTGDGEEVESVPGTGPILTQVEGMPLGRFTGVVFANELLDNLPFGVVEADPGGWREVRVGLADGGPFAEVVVPAPASVAADADHLLGPAGSFPPGTRLPLQLGVGAWFDTCGRAVRRGFVAVVDYAAEVADLAERGQRGWLRTYRAHRRGTPPLDEPGSSDITADVALGALRRAAARQGFTLDAEHTQAGWLRGLGLDELVVEGRAAWAERAHLGDLEALKARSTIHEADALTDPEGLGAHSVVVLAKGL
jgi:SAM-dependent MidA family methyltransferase